MITCEIPRAKIIYYPPDSALGNYCSIQVPPSDKRDAMTHADGKEYVCPKEMIAWFRKQVYEVVTDVRDCHPLLKKHRVGKPQFIKLLLHRDDLIINIKFIHRILHNVNIGRK
jgi:hypothetical protein